MRDNAHTWESPIMPTLFALVADGEDHMSGAR